MADKPNSVRFTAALAGLVLGAGLVAGAAFAASNGGGAGAGAGGGVGPATGANARQIDPAAAYAQGVEALAAEDYRSAIRLFRQVLEVVPDHAVSNYALGVAYVGDAQPRRARRPFERAAADPAAPPDTHLRLGLVYLQLDERADAEAQLAAITARVAACAAPECDAQRLAQLQAARDALAAALAPPADAAADQPPAEDPAPAPGASWNFPSSSEGRAAYAEAAGLLNQQRFAEALEVLSRASAAIGPHPDLLNYQGFASRKLGRYDDALGYYNQALAINRDHLGANEYLGELYLELGQLADARRQLQRLDELCAFGCAEREELARWIAQYASN